MQEMFEKVKEFLIKIVKDEAFRTQLMNDKFEEAEKLLQDRGYNFSKEEFETAAIKILELKDNGEFDELTEAELVGAVGGIASVAPEGGVFQPMYGVIYWPPDGHPKPWPRPLPNPKPFPQPQPMYGVVIGSLDVSAQE